MFQCLTTPIERQYFLMLKQNAPYFSFCPLYLIPLHLKVWFCLLYSFPAVFIHLDNPEFSLLTSPRSFRFSQYETFHSPNHLQGLSVGLVHVSIVAESINLDPALMMHFTSTNHLLVLTCFKMVSRSICSITSSGTEVRVMVMEVVLMFFPYAFS